MPQKVKPLRGKHRRHSAKPAEKIPVAFHPSLNEAHIIGGNKDAHAILTALFKACGWKVCTKSPSRTQSPKASRPSPPVTHSHYEKQKKVVRALRSKK